MKRIIFFSFLLMTLSSFVFSQESENSQISLCVYLPQNADIPDAAIQYLENHLNTLATADGTTDFVLCDRFILTAKVDVINKDIVIGPPQKISQTLSITLQIGDAVENKLYASTSLTVTGIGTNLTKSYIEAFKSINKKDGQVTSFLNKGRKAVVTYYQQNCDNIRKKAENLANIHQYSEALYLLASIPDIGGNCYDDCQSLMVTIVNKKINEEGLQNLQQAKMAWAKSQNENGANEAVNYIQQIHPNASCQNEVQKLITTMQSKLKADEDREWQFRVKQYNDRVHKELLQAQNEYQLQKASIQAAKEVAVAYVNSQPKKEYYVIW